VPTEKDLIDIILDIETAGVGKPAFGTHFYRSSIMEIAFSQRDRKGKRIAESLQAKPASKQMSTWSYETIWKPLREAPGAVPVSAMKTEEQILQQFLTGLQKLESGSARFTGWNIGYQPRAVAPTESLYAGYDIPGIMTRAKMYGMDEAFKKEFERQTIRDVGQEYAVKLSKGLYRQMGESGVNRLMSLGLLDPAAAKATKFQLADDYLEVLMTKNIDIIEIYKKLDPKVQQQITASSNIGQILTKIHEESVKVSGKSPIPIPETISDRAKPAQVPLIEQNLRRQVYGHYRKVMAAEAIVGDDVKQVARLISNDSIKLAGWAQETTQKTFMEFYGIYDQTGKAPNLNNEVVATLARQQGITRQKAWEMLTKSQAHLGKEDIKIVEALIPQIEKFEKTIAGPRGKEFFSIWGKHAQKSKMLNAVVHHGFSGSLITKFKSPDPGTLPFGGLYREDEFFDELTEQAKKRYGARPPAGAPDWKTALKGLSQGETLERKYKLRDLLYRDLSRFPGVPYTREAGGPQISLIAKMANAAQKRAGLLGIAGGILGAGLAAKTIGPLGPISDPGSEFKESIDPYWRNSLLGAPIVSADDDDFNFIKGFRNGRMGEDLRDRYTDFGSGWDPTRGRAEELSRGLYNPTEFYLDPNIETQRRLRSARKTGRDLSPSEVASYHRSYQYTEDALLSEYLLELSEEAPGLGSQWLLTTVGDYMSPGVPSPDTMYGVNLDPRILEFRKNILQDPAAYADFQEEYKAAQREGQEDLGKFSRGELFQDDLSRYEGISLHASNLRTINLKNFITEVEDADTLVLKRKGLMNIFDDPIHVRLAGIDAPEVAGHEHDPMAKWRINQQQPYGAQATSILQHLLQKGEGYESGFSRIFGEGEEDINLLIDPTQQTYGRYLGVLAGDQGRNINLELLEAGAVSALPWGGTSGDILDRSIAEQLEAEAAEDERGMWRYTRYKAIKEMGEALGTDITYNQYTDITKLAAKPDFAGWAGYLEGMGPRQYRPLAGEERSAIRGVANNLRRAGFSNRRRPTWQSTYNREGRTAKLQPLNPPSQNLKYKLFQPQIPLTSRDDAYVNVEGLRHGGMASSQRQQTDFGSGWDRDKNSLKEYYFPRTKETSTPRPSASDPSNSSSVYWKPPKDPSSKTSVAARGIQQSSIPAERISQVKNEPTENKKDLASGEFMSYSPKGVNSKPLDTPVFKEKSRSRHTEDKVNLDRRKSSLAAARRKQKLIRAHAHAVVAASKNSQNPGKRSRMNSGPAFV
jgi:endonuclease YncB( thermonuclease family)